jgi:hypothetical protein
VHGPLDVRVSVLVILGNGWICVIWLILPGCGIFMEGRGVGTAGGDRSCGFIYFIEAASA